MSAADVIALRAAGWCHVCADPWSGPGCYACVGGDCECPCEPKPDADEMWMRVAFGEPYALDAHQGGIADHDHSETP